MKDDVLARAISHARRRLLPFLLLMYIVAFLDRANIGFAKQTFQRSTGISDAAFALGAGLFFLSYALFEIPSNLILQRVGGRIWMSRIMVSWGIVSVGMMFARGPVSYYVLRLLLGFAEAGFFPGVILYLTYWFPNRARTQILGQFYFGAPLALIFGGPLSGLLLEMPKVAGLLGWQWMFLVEGTMAVLVGFWAFWFLTARPADASWLSNEERAALQSVLEAEEQTRTSHGPSSLGSALRDPSVIHFSGIYFLIQLSVYGVVFYLPSEVSTAVGKSVEMEVGLIAAIPWICALAAVIGIPRLGDSLNRHRIVAAMVLFVSGLASALFLLPNGVTALVALCVAASGFIGVQPLFWRFPTNYLAGRAAAGGIAVINAVGALGGFVAPNIKVWADHRFGFPSAGLYLLSGLTVVAAGLVWMIREDWSNASHQLSAATARAPKGV